MTFSLFLVASLLLAPAASAQTAAGDWSALRSVATGSRLSVKLKTGRTVEGTLTGVTDDALTPSRDQAGALRRSKGDRQR